MKILSFLLVLMLFLCLISCSKLNDNVIDQGVNSGPFYEDVSAEDFHVAFPVQLSYSLEMDSDPRIVLLQEKADAYICCDYISLNSYLATTNGCSFLAGFNKQDVVGTLFYRLFPELNKVPDIAKNGIPDLGLIKTAEADIIFFSDERYRETADTLYSQGYPAIICCNCGEWSSAGRNAVTFTEISSDNLSRETVFVGGEIESVQDRGILLQRDYIQECMKDLPFSEWKTVLFLGDTPRSVYTSPAADQIIDAGCGINVASDLEITDGYLISATVKGNEMVGGGLTSRFTAVSTEQILLWDPDVIWIPWFANYSAEDVLSDPALSSLSAVKAKEVYVFPGELEPWYYPTPAINLGYAWAANNLHPDYYSHEDLVSFAIQYYALLYGASFSAEEMGLK